MVVYFSDHPCTPIVVYFSDHPCTPITMVLIEQGCMLHWSSTIHNTFKCYYVAAPGSSGGGSRPSTECKKETTSWSSCSVTCGMGVSVRVTNDNADCLPEQQRRLCLVRPCELNDRHLVVFCLLPSNILIQVAIISEHKILADERLFTNV